MPNAVIPKNSDGVSKAPISGDLQTGEIATNTADGILYMKKADGSIVELGGGSGYTLPIASATILGGIKEGGDILIDTGGIVTLNVSGLVIDGSYVHTDNNFTTTLLNKLNAIEANATADQSASEIKTAYESNLDTNAFTDALLSKLNGIASGAEVNVQSDWNAISGDALILNKPTINGANWDTAYTHSQSVHAPSNADNTAANETSHADVLVDGDFISEGIMLRGATAGSYSILANNSANWNTAFGWGDHSLAGYLVASNIANMLETTDIGVTVQGYNANTVIDASYVHTDNNFTSVLLSKLNGIEAGATGDQTASEILTAIKTVDGAGSGLDADTLDGIEASALAPLASPALTGTPTAPTPTAGDNTTKLATTAFVATAVASAGGGTLNLSAGAYRFFYSQTVKSTGSTSFVKLFEFKINFSGSCRIKFGLKSSNSFAWVYARIYKNGVAIGTQRQSWNTIYDYFSEDFSGLNVGDLIQIYTKASSGYTGYVSNVSFASTTPDVIGEAI